MDATSDSFLISLTFQVYNADCLHCTIDYRHCCCCQCWYTATI